MNTHATTSLPIIVAGGGIGGLATTIGLSRAGYKVIALEKAHEFGEIGAGIQLGPNAFNALKTLVWLRRRWPMRCLSTSSS